MTDATDSGGISPPQTGISNGRASILPTPTPLQATSRESSLPAKIKDQLILESSSDDDDDESSDASELRRELVRRPPLPYSSLPTGLCYDARMRYHTELNPPAQRSDYHPEDPRRILAIYRTLCLAGLADDPTFKPKTMLVTNPLRRISTRHATRAEIVLVHDEHHFESLKETAGIYHKTPIFHLSDEILM